SQGGRGTGNCPAGRRHGAAPARHALPRGRRPDRYPRRRGTPARRAGPARRHRHRFPGGITMTTTVAPMTPDELARIQPVPDDGLGTLATERGNLPLERLEVHAAVTGLGARTELTQGFHNPDDVPLGATYIFPLPDPAAVTAMRMEADGRTVEAELRERAEARAAYDRAVAAGQRASIAEEERPDVFTMRVGNIMPGERVSVRLTLVGPLPYADGEATYRLPLVVAPRYIPGDPLPGGQVGDGTVPDTDQVSDASRITPPVLLPG